MNRYRVKIGVTLKKEVLDPQGAAVEKALKVLDYHNVQQVRVGKYLELTLEALGKEEAAAQVEELCRRFLTNPVIEDFIYSLEEMEAEARS